MNIHSLLCSEPPSLPSTSSRHTARPPPLPQPVKLAPHLLNPNHKYDSPSYSYSSKRSISALINDPDQPSPYLTHPPHSWKEQDSPPSPSFAHRQHSPHSSQANEIGTSPLRSELAVNPREVKRRSAASLDNIINHDPPYSPFPSPSSATFPYPPLPQPPDTFITDDIDSEGSPRKKHRTDDFDVEMEQLSRRPRGQRAPSGSLDIAASEPMTSARSVLHVNRPSRTPSPTPEAQAQSLALDLGPIPTSSAPKRDLEVDEELLNLIDETTKPAVASRPAPFGLNSRGASSSTRPTPDPEKDRASMPPPPPAKKKTKAQTKAPPKKAAARANTTKAVRKTKPAARSRSVSVAPPAVEDPATKAEGAKEEADEEEDTRLYCVCQTPYDDTKVMIGCDRCDGWYHPHCVNASDLIVELVDQYACPRCVEKNPGLQTTYKRRCFRGLSDPNPDSPSACHKPARGALSKYCSDDCGIKFIEARLTSFVDSGGSKERVWEAVKDAKKREWVVTLPNGSDLPHGDKEERVERELRGMNKLLENLEKMREQVEAGLDVLGLRERLLELACERAEKVGGCGWDQRLCFAEEEWAEFGDSAIESYNEYENGGEGDQGGMDVDHNEAGRWWCDGPEDCARHAGWQSLRRSDISQEREMKDEALANLTKRERQLRGRIEDALDPQTKVQQAKVPLPLSIDSVQTSSVVNGTKKGSRSKKTTGRI